MPPNPQPHEDAIIDDALEDFRRRIRESSQEYRRRIRRINQCFALACTLTALVFILSVYLLWQRHTTRIQSTPQDGSVAGDRSLQNGQQRNLVKDVVVQGDWVRDVVVQRGSVTFSENAILGNVTVILDQMARFWGEGRMVV
ncbi:MAG: hypothetical protein Q9180_005959, partial [Flavoplaca navasiana]